MNAALQMLPLRSIPAFLCPRPITGRQPPVMRLGYPLPYSWVEVYADEKGLLSLEDFPDRNVSCGISLSKTISKVIDHINECAGLTTYKVKVVPILHIKALRKLKEPFVFICVASNYLGDRSNVTPTGDDVEKLKSFLDLEDKPMWYLDAKEYVWADRELSRR